MPWTAEGSLEHLTLEAGEDRFEVIAALYDSLDVIPLAAPWRGVDVARLGVVSLVGGRVRRV
jgi:hypothetical protein